MSQPLEGQFSLASSLPPRYLSGMGRGISIGFILSGSLQLLVFFAFVTGVYPALGLPLSSQSLLILPWLALLQLAGGILLLTCPWRKQPVAQ